MSARTSRLYLTAVTDADAAAKIDLFTPTKLAGGTIFQSRLIVTNLDTDYNFDIGFSQDGTDFVIGQVQVNASTEAFESFTLMQYLSNLRSITVEQNTTLFVTPVRVLTATERVTFQNVVEEPGEA